MIEKILIGQVSRPRGLMGEIKMLVFDEGYLPDKIKTVYMDGKEYSVKSLQFFKGSGYLKVDGIDTIEAVENLRNKEIFAKRGEIAIPSDRYFIGEVLNSEVFSGLEYIGQLVDILQYGATDVYVVENNGERVHFPAIKKLIKSIDIKAKKIVLDDMVFKEVALFDTEK